MKKSFIYSALTAATAISITACSSGGGDVAGIGGSGVLPTGGFVSSGTVTGFGSIFVNGVEFETGSSTFNVDGNPDGVEGDLAIGMRVTVTGSVNADGITGTANSVEYDDEIQGPISDLSPPDTDGVNKIFKVFGTTVLINSTTTNFDISDDITTPGTFDFITLADKDHVEISGYFDSTGVLVATRVELESEAFNPGNDTVEIKGAITDLANNTFSLANITGLTIDASSAVLEDLPDNQLADGVFVEVNGRCSDASCTTVIASRIEAESGDFNDDDEVEFEGIITVYVDDGNFKVNGYPVDASSALKVPPLLALDNDVMVEVEGRIANGILVASQVKQEGGEIKVAAFVNSVDTAANRFVLEPVIGQILTIAIDSSTEIEDEINETIDNPAELLNTLMPGDFLTIEGYDDGTGLIVASSVELDTPDKVIVQGVVTTVCSGDATSGTVTVQGVAFPYDESTKFEDENDEGSYADAVAFCGDLEFGSSVVKIEDEDRNGTADEIDKES
ncbi:MAG: DUF5666 domain-containing protein [Gammaproteobacteria bacterium]